uniref:Phd finger protein n=1 Tax=Cucumis melo subsp. melo TaxID=412675 RepID=E5GCG2_CUCME|nr:phd finger protein [Cucumis melo subsp. melo]
MLHLGLVNLILLVNKEGKPFSIIIFKNNEKAPGLRALSLGASQKVRALFCYPCLSKASHQACALSLVEGNQLEGSVSGHDSSISAVHGKAGESLGSYLHPFVREKMTYMLHGKLLNVPGGEISRCQESPDAGSCYDHQHQHLDCKDLSCNSGEFSPKQQGNKKIGGIIKMSPEDEIEGEIIFYQHRLLANAVSRKRFTDHLICNVVKSLPKEIDEARSTRWDAILINQYYSGLREAKKQGKKERRHKEAQAVLAAATAAAAASSRMSSFRKDVYEESTHRELMPRAKETPTKVALPKTSLESDFCKEHARSCDICRRPETMLKPILVCSSCKVSVHLDCYRTVKESSGPWCCELCEELSLSRGSGAPVVNFWEKSYFVAECGLCGGTTGAFRKSSDGQWVHAFCAECNYGHCQSTFHPSCSRSAGCYMTVKSSGGKLQHRAYCEKHSSEQRAKVELERLRLLCERIIKREKIKRDLVLCSHDVLAFKRDHVARSVLVRSPFFLPEVSSESATTSLKGHVEDLKSCSEAVQRSDDVTVDSTVSIKHWNKVPLSLDTEQKTDEDSTTSQNPFPRKFADRALYAGKQIPQRSSTTTSRNLLDGGLRFKSRKHAETFQKELVMTSDQASMKNSLLPKQYLYVPADVLAKEKQANQEPGSAEPPKCDSPRTSDMANGEEQHGECGDGSTERHRVLTWPTKVLALQMYV